MGCKGPVGVEEEDWKRGKRPCEGIIGWEDALGKA